MRSTLVGLGTAAALLACWPTEPCACPPALGIGTVYGRVTAADGAPVAGIEVHIHSPYLDCTAGENTLVDRPFATAGADGRYRYQIRSLAPAASSCVRASVLAGSDTLATAVRSLRLVSSYGSGARPDSVRIDLQLR